MLARVLVNTQAGKTDYPQAIKLLQTATEDIDNDSAVDAQMLLGLIYANGVEVAGRRAGRLVVQAEFGTFTHGLRRVLGRDVVQAG
jgi:TPR repeat protein